MNLGNGRVKNVTTRKAFLMKLRELAIKGNMRALERCLESPFSMTSKTPR